MMLTVLNASHQNNNNSEHGTAQQACCEEHGPACLLFSLGPENQPRKGPLCWNGSYVYRDERAPWRSLWMMRYVV